MYIFATILTGIARVLQTLFSLYTLCFVLSAVISWVNPDPYNRIVRTLRALTEPVLWRIRRALPFVYISGLDLSPIVAILGLQFLDFVVVRILFYLAGGGVA